MAAEHNTERAENTPSPYDYSSVENLIFLSPEYMDIVGTEQDPFEHSEDYAIPLPGNMRPELSDRTYKGRVSTIYISSQLGFPVDYAWSVCASGFKKDRIYFNKTVGKYLYPHMGASNFSNGVFLPSGMPPVEAGFMAGTQFCMDLISMFPEGNYGMYNTKLTNVVFQGHLGHPVDLESLSRDISSRLAPQAMSQTLQIHSKHNKTVIYMYRYGNVNITGADSHRQALEEFRELASIACRHDKRLDLPPVKRSMLEQRIIRHNQWFYATRRKTYARRHALTCSDGSGGRLVPLAYEEALFREVAVAQERAETIRNKIQEETGVEHECVLGEEEKEEEEEALSPPKKQRKERDPDVTTWGCMLTSRVIGHHARQVVHK